ncbi:MAG TPA: ABC transporter ATP-binding protein [Longimicrobium sp.]|nr:ABC transporter ATP-binding protein [Longimicrobium sp.]HSU14417.1 ABC transporter ATP-binding protein [Longimicrobium sp.]
MELVIDHLWKTYPNGVAALQDVSLTIPPGLFGLLGPNGAGKSTLMRILATLQEADAGRVQLGEVDVLRDREAVRRTLGYLPQEFGVYPRISAEAMLDHFALLKGITHRRERRETVDALLQQTNLWNARKQRLGGFSGGMRQRFGIAVALIGRPRLIIVDEPTAGLDPAERARFLNLLSELGEAAVVILSTHIVEDVSDLCTRMAIIQGGRILLEGEPAGAVDAVRGRIWRRQVDRAELPAFEHALPVISTTLVGGRTVIHVFGDAPPDPTFEPVEPDLKDVYFTVIRGIQVDARGAASEPSSESPAASPYVNRVMGDEMETAGNREPGIPPPAFHSTAAAPAMPDPAPAPSDAAPPPITVPPSTFTPPPRPTPEPSGPGRANMPFFGEMPRGGADPRAGISRENRDAVPPADADPDQPEGA